MPIEESNGVFLSKGDKGDLTTLEVGTVTLGTPSVNIEEVGPVSKLSFVLPVNNLTMGTVTTSTSTPGIVGPQGPTGPVGPQGVPGGWVSIPLGTADLDTITTEGVYRQTATADATTARHYPQANVFGILFVTQGNGTSWMQQEFHSAVGPNASTAVYRRNRSGGVWGPWKAFYSHRLDNTAGRAIYEYNDTTGGEQLIYGDTGQRSIISDQPWIDALLTTNVVFNAGNIARVRRIGYEVELTVALDKNSTGSYSSSFSFPVGFRPSQPFNVMGSNSGLAIVRAYHGGGSTGINWNSTAVATAASITMKYTTVDAWPTTLPGTAVGSIPNL
jgi:hypothetical protein